MPQEFNVLALLKGKEKYIYVFDDNSRHRLLHIFRDNAADPRLSFSWFDAAVLTDKAREPLDAEQPDDPSLAPPCEEGEGDVQAPRSRL